MWQSDNLYWSNIKKNINSQYQMTGVMRIKPWYVDGVNGNDSNSGTSPSSPVKTLTRLFNLIDTGANAANRILITPGTYEIGDAYLIARIIYFSAWNVSNVEITLIGRIEIGWQSVLEFDGSFETVRFEDRVALKKPDHNGVICVWNHSLFKVHKDLYVKSEYERGLCASAGGAIDVNRNCTIDGYGCEDFMYKHNAVYASVRGEITIVETLELKNHYKPCYEIHMHLGARFIARKVKHPYGSSCSLLGTSVGGEIRVDEYDAGRIYRHTPEFAATTHIIN